MGVTLLLTKLTLAGYSCWSISCSQNNQKCLAFLSVPQKPSGSKLVNLGNTITVKLMFSQRRVDTKKFAKSSLLGSSICFDKHN